MKKLSVYSIPFVGLKEGEHIFHYNVNASFFEEFEHSPISESELEIELILDKKVDFFQLHFGIGGWIKAACDRCMEDFNAPIEGRHSIYVKFEDELIEQNELESDIMYISRTETHVNVKQLLYEFSILSIPMRKVHDDDDEGNASCNLKVLNQLNNENDDAATDGETDPRWEALKQLKND